MPQSRVQATGGLHRHKQSLGRRGEALAAAHLLHQGYVMVARNWRCPAGEIDIVARDGDCLVLVEVRTRRGGAFGTPEESITPRKQAKMVEVAQTYMQMEGQENAAWRIDVVAIEIGPRGETTRLNHLCNAVEG
jgi:putative endonuclease